MGKDAQRKTAQDSKALLRRLEALGNPRNVAGMARFGINPDNTYGVPIPVLRRLAKEVGRSHDMALDLWMSGIHEARILASMVDEPSKVTDTQLERWVNDFDSWDVCDQCCGNLIDKTEGAFEKAVRWARSEKTFVKRAGFATIAWMAFHDKTMPDERFLQFLPIIEKTSTDERNYVKKAVNWALRQIGKRNMKLNRAAIKTAKAIARLDSRAARWVASDALRELTDPRTLRSIEKREHRSATARLSP